MELIQFIPGESSRKKSVWVSVNFNPKTVNRFSKSKEKQFVPPTFVDLPVGLSPAEVDQFYREQRVDELARKLRVNALELGDPDIRGASPPPSYDQNGVRTNSREVRVKRQMEEEFARLSRWLVKRIPDYLPPSDLFRASKITRKLEIPTNDFPDTNFVAVIVGPRGINHKYLQDESRCRIEFRGQTSSSNSQTYEEAQLPLHVHIEGDTDEEVDSAIALIGPLLDPSSPEFQRARAGVTDTISLISSGKDSLRCSICQAIGHSATNCPDASVIQHIYGEGMIKCSICGGKGHLTRDCSQNAPVDGYVENSAPTGNSSSSAIPVEKPNLASVTLPVSLIGAFIGVQGTNIKRLMIETGCNIQVDQSKTQQGGTECPLVFTGPPDAIARARNVCQEWIENYNNSKDERSIAYQQQRMMAGLPIGFTDPEAAAQAVQMAYYQQMMWQAWMAQYGGAPPK
jgi:hypothetical protein